MGLVYKIYFFHMPSAWMFLVAALIAGVASLRFLFLKRPARRRMGARRRGTRGAVRRVHAGDRAALGAQGVGRVVAVGCAADLEPDAVPDLRRLYAAAQYGGPGSDKLARRHGAVRHGQRAVHLRLGELLAHDSIPDIGRADAADRDGRSVVVLRDGVHVAVRGRCCRLRARSNTSARGSRRFILPRTNRDAMFCACPWLMCACWRLTRRRATRNRSRRPRIRAGRRDAARRADSGDAADRARLRVHLGGAARLRVVDCAPAAATSKRSCAELESRRNK